MIYSFSDPISYYRPDIKVTDIRTTDLTNQNSITVIPYGFEIYGFDAKNFLTTNNFTLTKTQNFRSLTTEIWTK